MKRVTGIGGIFFKAKDPKALGAWYREHLGLDVSEWGGAVFQWGGAGSDTLNGGTGVDVMTGGTGADRFVFVARDGADVITDFGAGDMNLSELKSHTLGFIDWPARESDPDDSMD